MAHHNSPHPAVSRPLQRRFLSIPQSPLCYWLRDRFFDLLAGRTLGDVATFTDGVAVRTRFMRFIWETSTSGARWMPYAKGGAYGRWAGADIFVYDWEEGGVRVKRWVVETHPADKLTLLVKPHRTDVRWVNWTRGSVGCRIIGPGYLIAHTGPAARSDILGAPALAALLHSRTMVFFLRAIASRLHFTYRDVMRLPVPAGVEHVDWSPAQYSQHLKSDLVSTNYLERAFAGVSCAGRRSLSKAFDRDAKSKEALSAALQVLEAKLEREVATAYGIGGGDLEAVLDETGTPAGWYPLIAGYDTMPPLPEETMLPADLLTSVTDHPRLRLADSELAELKGRLRALYGVGPGEVATSDEPGEADDEDNEDDGDSAGARIPIPTETFLEELAGKLEIHPISVCWLLRELRELEGVVCRPERTRFVEDYLSVTVLRLLGHRWPREVESGEPRAAWAEESGIIPITESTGERSLLARVKERLAADFGDEHVNAVEREFQEIVGVPLDEWLASAFFARHVSQFRKRPIAWQIQSAPPPARRRRGEAPRRPAFACLVYYHKVDGDLVSRLRAHHVGPLLARMQTELAGLAQGGEQETRRVQLEEASRELQDLDRRLEEIAAQGFGGEAMRGRLRQHALDDALLSLKARWLRRLSEAAAAGPLTSWLAAAREAEFDDRLATWIEEAIAALSNHCSSVGPGAPDEATLAADPTTAEMAAPVAADSKGMTRAALGLACDRWWGRLTTDVFAPVRAQIAESEREVKRLVRLAGGRRNIKHLSAVDREQLHAREERVKTLKNELGDKQRRARELRERIEAWACDEAATWGPWLAGQPLYDEVSSGSAHRSPPATVLGFVTQEASYLPGVNDGVRVNLAPFQRAGLLATDVLPQTDLERALAERAQWRADDRRWCREGRLPNPGWLADA